MQSRNTAARAVRWSAQHRKKAIFGWLAFVLVSVIVGGALGMKEIAAEDLGDGESKRADQTLADGFPDRASEEVLVQGRGNVKADDPRFTAAVRDVVRSLSSFETVRDVKSPLDSGNAAQFSPDGRSALVTFDLLGDDDELEDNVTPVLAAMARVQSANPALRVEQFGDASTDKALSKAFEDDLRKAETLSLPITLVILVLAFGALVAAGIPLLLAITAVAAALGLVTRHTGRPAQGAGGESGGTLGGSLSPGGRVDLRACRARLGRHGDDRDGGDVHHRQCDLHVFRDGHDHRCRHRGAWLADRLARGAVEARRSRRLGSCPVQAPHAGR